MTNRTLAVLALSAMFSATACDDDVVLQDTPAGAHAYEHEAQSWLEWAFGQPWSTGPVTDTTGDQCHLDQSGKVWYLAGSTGGPVERSCTIPEHDYVFFPLVNRWILHPDATIDDEAAMDELVTFGEEYFADNRAHTCSLTLRLDGEDLLGDTETLDEELYVDVLDPFELDVDDDNFASEFGLAGGTYPAIIDGHYALLRPLEEGEHTLELGGVLCDGEEIWFETSAVYHLEVD